jgi:hypothetical protein
MCIGLQQGMAHGLVCSGYGYLPKRDCLFMRNMHLHMLLKRTGLLNPAQRQLVCPDQMPPVVLPSSCYTNYMCSTVLGDTRSALDPLTPRTSLAVHFQDCKTRLSVG